MVGTYRADANLCCYRPPTEIRPGVLFVLATLCKIDPSYFHYILFISMYGFYFLLQCVFDRLKLIDTAINPEFQSFSVATVAGHKLICLKKFAFSFLKISCV